jgi:hypothetical protein
MHSRTKEVAQFLSETPAPKELMESYVYQLTSKEKLLDVIVRHAEPSSPNGIQGGSLLDAIVDTDVRSFQPVSKVLSAQEKQEQSRTGAAILDAIVNSPGAKLESAQGTWWGAFNGVTYYADHINVRGNNRESRLESAWFGERSKLKASALELAVQYASAQEKL